MNMRTMRWDGTQTLSARGGVLTRSDPRGGHLKKKLSDSADVVFTDTGRRRREWCAFPSYFAGILFAIIAGS